MKAYRNGSNPNRHNEGRKPKRSILRRFFGISIILCFCIPVFTVGWLTNRLPLTEDNPPSTQKYASGAPVGTNSNDSTTPIPNPIPIEAGDISQKNSTGDTGENPGQNHAGQTLEFSNIGDDTDDADDADNAGWCLVLVNKWNSLPDNYEVELEVLPGGESVDKRIYSALQEMLIAARNEGIYPIVVSGYRTAEEQQNLMDEKIAEFKAEGCSDEEALNKAEAFVSKPGTSEHQLGTAVDINADGINSAGYEVYEWLEKNSYMYGFIVRYSNDKTEITGIIDEPWHYRYVGVEAATEIYNQGLCLEEYLVDIKDSQTDLRSDN